jgi:hypothetical protein
VGRKLSNERNHTLGLSMAHPLRQSGLNSIDAQEPSVVTQWFAILGRSVLRFVREGTEMRARARLLGTWELIEGKLLHDGFADLPMLQPTSSSW